MTYMSDAELVLIEIDGVFYSFWESCDDGTISVPEETKSDLTELNEQYIFIVDLLFALDSDGHKVGKIQKTGEFEVCLFDDED